MTNFVQRKKALIKASILFSFFIFIFYKFGKWVGWPWCSGGVLSQILLEVRRGSRKFGISLVGTSSLNIATLGFFFPHNVTTCGQFFFLKKRIPLCIFHPILFSSPSYEISPPSKKKHSLECNSINLSKLSPYYLLLVGGPSLGLKVSSSSFKFRSCCWQGFAQILLLLWACSILVDVVSRPWASPKWCEWKGFFLATPFKKGSILTLFQDFHLFITLFPGKW